MNADNTDRTQEIAFIRSFENAASSDAAFNLHPVLHPALHLRPHHLLCLQTFIGHGYSEEFVRRMTIVKNQLEQDPLTFIEVVEGADDLCAACPNNTDGQCTSDKPAVFDLLVRNKLQLSSNNIKGIPTDLKISVPLIEECCPDCEWKELCLEQARERLP